VARTSRSLGLPYDSLVVGKRLRKLRLKCGSVESRDNVEDKLLAGVVMVFDTFLIERAELYTEMYETRLLRRQYCSVVYQAEDGGSWTGIYNKTSMRGAAGMQLTPVSIPHCFATAHSRTTTDVESWFEFARA
jgi:hypothetical protein